VDRMEQAYVKAQEISERTGVPIFNATAGGHLEVFPRVDFGQIFRK